MVEQIKATIWNDNALHFILLSIHIIRSVVLIDSFDFDIVSEIRTFSYRLPLIVGSVVNGFILKNKDVKKRNERSLKFSAAYPPIKKSNVTTNTRTKIYLNVTLNVTAEDGLYGSGKWRLCITRRSSIIFFCRSFVIN